MPGPILLASPEDLRWLAETHAPGADQYALAILYGNEDCPTRVELYRADFRNCRPDVLVADEFGDLVPEADSFD